MKTIRQFLLFSLLSSVCSFVCSAANHAVAPGQNVQAVVDGAASGDLIRFLPGVYGDLTIVNKDLTLKALGTTPAHLGNLEVNGSVVTLIKIGAETLRANDLPGDASKIIAIQASYGHIETNATEFHLAYSDVKYLVFRGKGTVTACEFDGNDQGGIAVDVHGAGTRLVIRNNLIHDYSLRPNTPTTVIEQCIGVRVRDGAKADVLNNVITLIFIRPEGGGCSQTDSGIGVYVKEDSRATILGNYISWCETHGSSNTRGDRLVYAPLNTVLRHNALRSYHPSYVDHNLVNGGVTPVDCIDPEPKDDNPHTFFENYQINDWRLKADSPLKDKGPPDAQYNDLDGTRNDIGMFGGHGYLPNGRATTKPIVLSLEIEPLVVPSGGIITIESTGATVK